MKSSESTLWPYKLALHYYVQICKDIQNVPAAVQAFTKRDGEELTANDIHSKSKLWIICTTSFGTVNFILCSGPNTEHSWVKEEKQMQLGSYILWQSAADWCDTGKWLSGGKMDRSPSVLPPMALVCGSRNAGVQITILSSNDSAYKYYCLASLCQESQSSFLLTKG